MKKIFTLLCASAMLTPMAFATNVKISVYESSSSMNASPGALMGTITNDMTYDEATVAYTITNFLGYENAIVTFRVATDKDMRDYDMDTVDKDGMECLPVIFMVPDDAPTATNITKYANNMGTKICFNLDPDDEYFPDDDVFRSGVITGDGEEYMLVDAGVWGNSTKSIENPNLLSENFTVRTYAVKEGDNYKFYFKVDAMAQWVNSGAAWDFEDYPAPSVYLVFSSDLSGIDTIIANEENAPVEYFNLQGVRIENPAQGLFIRRQGGNAEKVVIR